ncbi:MAG: class I SAM-dependent methyltransferase [bacterium]|nr:class I SAM-dependent methyltransferase [bacterium]
MNNQEERSCWDPVLNIMGKDISFSLGKNLSDHFRNSPYELIQLANFYKFAAKAIGSSEKVLDISCGEGLGTWILAAECGSANGIDTDRQLIEKARNNWNNPGITLVCSDIYSVEEKDWDAIVIYNITRECADEKLKLFLNRVFDILGENGVAILSFSDTCSDFRKTCQQEIKTVFQRVFWFHFSNALLLAGYSETARHLVSLACK